MPDDIDLTPEDELEDDYLEDTEVEDSEDSEEQSGEVDRLAQLEARLTSMEGQNVKLVRDFSSAVGRVQSLIDRLESGRQYDTERLKTQINSAVGGVEKQLDTILESDIVDPEIRARAQQARDRLRAETEQAQMKAEVEALKAVMVQRQQQPVVDPSQLSPLEVNVHTMIADANLKIDDFDWNEANSIYAQRGEPGVYAYFTNKIAERKAEATAAERRQVKKTNAGKGSPSASGTGGDVTSKLASAAESGNIAEGIELLRSLGVTI